MLDAAGRCWTLMLDAAAPDLGEDHRAVLQPRAVARLVAGEGGETVAALEAGVPRLLASLQASKECLLGLVEPGQRVLEDMTLDGGVRWNLRTHVLQLRFLLLARAGDVGSLIGAHRR
jgi:hypothetical protein